ncbi:MAG: glycoside hydrolase family 43 protein [Ferruginibacter sp.]
MKLKPIHILLLLISVASCASQKNVYLFTSFHEPANEGLRMLYSKDGYKWKSLDSIFLKPIVGNDKIMRDPSMIQGPDGIFRLVWTTEWKAGNGFGYASSKDLIHWSEQEYVPVMKNEPTVKNVWAPELFYDDQKSEYIIVFASCIPNRFEKGIEDEDNNHRLYYTTTKDFKIFSDTKLFFDPKFSSIDAVIVKKAMNDYVLVLKDNTRPNRNIKVAFSNKPLGPFENVSASFTEKFTEGPAVAKVKDGWLIYYDAYQKKKYGAVFTKDFKTFVNADNLITIPEGHKHGTIVMTDRKMLKKLIRLKG